MAIPLRTYDKKIAPSTRTVGVELSSQAMQMPARAMERAIEQTGQTAIQYVEKKKQAKEASDRANYEQMQRALTNKINQDKSDFLQKGGSYKDTINEVFRPSLQKFQSAINEAGFTDDMTQWAMQQSMLDAERLIGSEILNIENTELKNYTTSIQQAMVSNYAENMYITEEFKAQQNDLANIIGDEKALAFAEGIRVENIDNFGKTISLMESEEQQDKSINALRESISDLSPAAKMKADIKIDNLHAVILKARTEKFETAISDTSEALIDGTFDLFKYEEVRSGLPVYQQELIDQQIVLQTEATAKRNPEGQAAEVIETVRQYRTGKITAEQAFERFRIKGQGENTTGRTDISSQTQALFFVAMNEAMESQAKHKSPIEKYNIYKGTSQLAFNPMGGFGYRTGFPVEVDLTFGDYGGDFLDTLFDVSGPWIQDPISYMISGFSAFKQFRKDNPTATQEEYRQFKLDNFGMAAAAKIRSITGRDTKKSTITDEDLSLIISKKENK